MMVPSKSKKLYFAAHGEFMNSYDTLGQEQSVQDLEAEIFGFKKNVPKES